jgi:hypothetical protein
LGDAGGDTLIPFFHFLILSLCWQSFAKMQSESRVFVKKRTDEISKKMTEEIKL